MAWHVSPMFTPFLTVVLLYVYTTFCLSIHLLMDIVSYGAAKSIGIHLKNTIVDEVKFTGRVFTSLEE